MSIARYILSLLWILIFQGVHAHCTSFAVLQTLLLDCILSFIGLYSIWLETVRIGLLYILHFGLRENHQIQISILKECLSYTSYAISISFQWFSKLILESFVTRKHVPFKIPFKINTVTIFGPQVALCAKLKKTPQDLKCKKSQMAGKYYSHAHFIVLQGENNTFLSIKEILPT